MGYQELFIILGFEAKGYFVVGVQHPHGGGRKQPFNDGEHGALAGAGVALDHGNNTEIVELLNLIKEPADERHEVDVHIAVAQLVLYQAVEQGGVCRLPREDAADVVPGGCGVVPRRLVEQLVGDDVDDAVVEPKIVRILLHKREVLVVDGLHVLGDVGELAGALEEDRVALEVSVDEILV